MGLFKRQSDNEKTRRSFSEWAKIILTVIGVPTLAYFIGSIYLLQKDLNENSLSNKESQVELLETLTAIKDATIESKDSQLEIAKSLSSDKALIRLLEAKNAYDTDLKGLKIEIEKITKLLDSAGIQYDKIKLANTTIQELINENKILSDYVLKEIEKNKKDVFYDLPNLFQSRISSSLLEHKRLGFPAFSVGVTGKNIKDLTDLKLNDFTFSNDVFGLGRNERYKEYIMGLGLRPSELTLNFSLPIQYNFHVVRGLSIEPVNPNNLVFNVRLLKDEKKVDN